MYKTFLKTGFALLLSVSAFATDSLSLNVAEVGTQAKNVNLEQRLVDTGYGQVARLYDQGDATYFLFNIAGYYRGTCFYKERPSREVSSLLGIYVDPVGVSTSNSAANLKHIVIVSGQNGYFNNLTASVREEVSTLIERENSRVATSFFSESSNAILTAISPNTLWQTRKFRNHILAEISNATTGEVTSYCYYHSRTAL